MQGEVQSRPSTRLEKKKTTEKSHDDDVYPSLDTSLEASAMAGLQASISAMHADLRAMRSDVRKELEEVRKDMADYKKEIHNKMSELAADLQSTVNNAEQTEQRVAQVEEWSADTKEIMASLLEDNERTHEKLLDLEMRSRRQNLRLYNVPEDSEKNDMTGFINNFIKTELALDMDLGIQRCYRSLASRPPPGATPRSIVICFMEDKTKEKVRSTAWQKKTVLLNGRRVFFDHDWPQEIQKKRSAYGPIRTLLKNKNIAFRTPPLTKLRVFYEGNGLPAGPSVTYNSMEEAAEDLKKRGIMSAEGEDTQRPTTIASTSTPTTADNLARLRKASSSAKARTEKSTKAEALKRAAQKLQEFRRASTPPPPPRLTRTDLAVSSK